MKVQHLIRTLEQLPWDAQVVGVMSDEVERTKGLEQYTVPDGKGYHTDVFWDSENNQVAVVLG